ncbi:ChrR family anti-sigma-E factor [Novispirillum itersonii]|uniref:ChrR family anti-sigma-E factor n=1 Tax=Novispirillum itersonii TaxID=189 RepID=UPI00035C8419|nr:ChrR family anti-sigma-E factor [Novispirillum itersonii]
MSATFHPPEELLLAYAAGSLEEASALLVACHLTLCPACRRLAGQAEAVGGSLLEELAPASLSDGALAAVLGRLGPVSATARPAVRQAPARPQPPRPGLLPRPLRDYVGADSAALPWKRLPGGLEQVPVVTRTDARARLYRIAPGMGVPEHSHGGLEMTLVLAGGFSDGHGHYGPGDVAVMADGGIHRPVADAGDPCLCLAVTTAPLRLTGLIGRLFNPFLDL